eukprot:GILK01003752.1.p1 GENE.GILK01003752.1~~GILK01003752.1.p1  ORF type:complete len:497 (+),score=49.29 GILK01003752.1:86-1576(+)
MMRLYLLLLWLLRTISALDVQSGFKSSQVDPSSSLDQRIFPHFFYYVPDYFKPGGPVLLMAGPERALYTTDAASLAWHAHDLGGYIVALEHRYYGKSLPFGNSSYELQNLVHLKIDNVLADLAAFVQYLKRANPFLEKSPVFVFGGSYGGLLSALFRIKYPDVVAGSIASSAPMFLLGSGVSDSSWFDTASESYIAHDETCGSQVEAAFSLLWSDLLQGNNDKVQTALNLCTSPKNKKHRLLPFVKTAFASIAQFSYACPKLMKVEWPLDLTCQRFNDAKSAPELYQALSESLWLYYNSTGELQSCMPFEGSAAAKMQSLAHGPPSFSFPSSMPSLDAELDGVLVSPVGLDTVPWHYTCCTEFFHPVSGKGIFVFDNVFNETAVRSYCQTLFPGTQLRIYDTGMLPTDTSVSFSNVLFSSGKLEPGRGYMPHTNYSATVMSFVVERAGHTFDVMLPCKNEPPALASLRLFERDVIRGWMHQWALERNSNISTLESY